MCAFFTCVLCVCVCVCVVLSSCVCVCVFLQANNGAGYTSSVDVYSGSLTLSTLVLQLPNAKDVGLEIVTLLNRYTSV